MKKGLVWGLLSFLIAITLMFTSCSSRSSTTVTSTATVITTTTNITTSSIASTSTPTSTTLTTLTTTTNTGNWWDTLGTPRYGGTMTLASDQDFVTFDPYAATNTDIEGMWFQRLFSPNWTEDPNSWNYEIQFTPDQYEAGEVASSWEFTGLGTFVVGIRHGIYWQNIAPVNGREFTAADVVYHFDRLYGLGDGFAKPDPNFVGDPVMSTLTSITATDNYTVTFQFSLNNPEAVLETLEAVGQNSSFLEASDAVNQFGNLNNWHDAIGTGPFILTDFVDDTSATLSKNQNFWEYDERYSQNKLPYVDSVHYLIIAQSNTILAAVRTGKVDILDNQTLQTAQQMKTSNPSIVQQAEPATQADTVEPNDSLAPFNILNVREAMQMALNLPLINSSYYSGTCSPDPSTMTSNFMTGWGFPYSQWPASLQAQYAYNPAQAKQLLAAAGYPNGFNTNIIVDSSGEQDLIQIVQSEFAAVGINMSITTMDSASWINYVLLGHKETGLASRAGNGGWLGYTYEPIQEFNPFVTGFFANYTVTSDQVIDADSAKAISATTVQGLQAALTDANKEIAQQHFVISLLQPNIYSFCQPWVKGYNGQISALTASPGLFPGLCGFYQARFWIDQGLEQ